MSSREFKYLVFAVLSLAFTFAAAFKGISGEPLGDFPQMGMLFYLAAKLEEGK